MDEINVPLALSAFRDKIVTPSQPRRSYQGVSYTREGVVHLLLTNWTSRRRAGANSSSVVLYRRLRPDGVNHCT